MYNSNLELNVEAVRNSSSSTLNFSGDIKCDVAAANANTAISGEIVYESGEGLTHILAHVVYGNNKNLNFTLDLEYYADNCSALNYGAGSLTLYRCSFLFNVFFLL